MAGAASCGQPRLERIERRRQPRAGRSRRSARRWLRVLRQHGARPRSRDGVIGLRLERIVAVAAALAVVVSDGSDGGLVAAAAPLPRDRRPQPAPGARWRAMPRVGCWLRDCAARWLGAAPRRRPRRRCPGPRRGREDGAGVFDAGRRALQSSHGRRRGHLGRRRIRRRGRGSVTERARHEQRGDRDRRRQARHRSSATSSAAQRRLGHGRRHRGRVLARDAPTRTRRGEIAAGATAVAWPRSTSPHNCQRPQASRQLARRGRGASARSARHRRAARHRTAR